MRILVTGAAGFVGAHLVRALAGLDGAAVVTSDRAAGPDALVQAAWAPWSDRIAYRRLDVTDRASVAALMAEVAPTHVVHAAALTPTPAEEAADPAQVVEVNLGGTLAVTDAATARGVARLILVSSAGVFAPRPVGPLAEDTPTDGTNLYAVTKRAAEGIVARLGVLRGVSTVSVRLASVYGPLERATPSRPRASIVHRIAAAEGASVAGPDVARDWVHADDAASAMARLLAAPRLAHDLYHLGGGEAVGWYRLVAAFRAAGRTLREVPPAEAAVAMTPADARPVLAIERLKAEIDFRPRPIEAGIRDLLCATNSREAAA